MDKTLVCAVGNRPDAIYPALREFTVAHVHMFTHPRYKREARRLTKDLEKFGIPHTRSELDDNIWESVFRNVSEFAKTHPHPERIVVHVGIGDRDMQCAATAASFVNGLHAVNGDKNFIMGLPVMRFSYYKLLNERKMRILGELQDGPLPMNELSFETPYVSLTT